MIEIELDRPYELMYEELCEEFGEGVIKRDMKTVIQNTLHESSVKYSTEGE